MIKHHQDQLASAAPVSGVPFDECGFTTQQARQILAAGKTRFFEEILPELESYLEGTRRIITGRSIRAYRERKIAEPRQKLPTPRRKPKIRNENGVTGKPAAP
jgi:hypothetical protein